MEKTNNTYKVELKKDFKLYALPFAIWLLLCIIPMSLAIQYISHTIKLQNIDKVANTYSQLTRKSLKLQNDLKPNSFIDEILEIDKLTLYFNSWIEKKNTTKLNKHVLLNISPKYNSMNEQSVIKLASSIKELIGIKPSFILTFSSKEKECRFFFQTPFKLKCNKQNLIKSIQKSYANLRLKNEIYSVNKRYQTILPQIITREHLGIIGSVFSYLNFNRIRFSSVTNSSIKLISVPILRKNAPIKYILIGIDLNNLDPFTILRQRLAKYQSNNTYVKFGYSNKDTPYYYNNASETSLLAALPLELKSLLSNHKSVPSALDSVIKLSIDSNASVTSLQLLSINLKRVFLPLAFLMLLAIRYNFSQNKKVTGNTLKQSIFTGIYFSALIPIIFASLFWLIHSRIEENNKNSRVMEFMDAKVREIDIRMNNSRNRYLMYTNHRVLDTSNAKTVSHAIKKLDLSSSHVLGLNYDIVNAVTSANIDYVLRSDKSAKFSNVFKGLTSIIKGILIKINFFHFLNRKQIKKLQLQYDTSLAAVSELVPIHKIASLLKNLGGFTNKLFDTSKTRTIGHLLKLNKSNQFSVFLMLIARAYLIDNEFRKEFIRNEMDKVFYKYDFDIRFYIYVTGSTNANELSWNHSPFMGNKATLFKHKAVSLYASQKNIRQINLSNKAEPNIVFARPIANNEYFAIGYATPSGNRGISPFFRFIVLGIFISLLTSLFIAWSVTNILLMPIPPTLKAITELKKNNFAWEIQVNSGDELSLLHKSFNSLSLTMLERNKMQKLVSEDIAEMISIGSMQTNQKAKSLYATVLFSDIREFTTISEKYNAEEVVSMLNEYFTAMVCVIQQHGGKINQLIGDAIQAVFYDNQDQSSAERAVLAAKEMRRELQKLNASRVEKGLYIIKNGIGLSTGDIITGIVGSNTGRLDSTIIGDTVLIAEELESFSKHASKSFILVDKPTSDAIENMHSNIEFHSNNVNSDIKIFEIDNIT